MTDVAYANALHRRDDIAKQINAMQDSLAALKREAERVDRFLREWEEFASLGQEAEHTENLITEVDSKAVDNSERATGNPPKEDIGRFARGLIEAKGEPVSRNALFAALEAAGIHLRGADPKMVLSTMMWRLSRPTDDLIRLKPLGYWIRERPYPPANYIPGQDTSNADQNISRSMPNKDISEDHESRLKSLADEIERASVAYHRDDAPFMSDADYDAKKRQLAEMQGQQEADIFS